MLVSAALVALTAWQAASLLVGLIVCAGFCGVAIVLQLTRLAARSDDRAAHGAIAARFPSRHAVLHLSRPGNQTRVILLAVGLGAFFIIGVRSLQASLLRSSRSTRPPMLPTCFSMDVQRDQAEGVRAFLDRSGQSAPAPFRLIPVLRARVTGVNGREKGPREL